MRRIVRSYYHAHNTQLTLSVMDKLVQLVAYRDWIIGVSCQGESHFLAWVITPEAIALNDGESYSSAFEAMKSGRILVLTSVD